VPAPALGASSRRGRATPGGAVASAWAALVAAVLLTAPVFAVVEAHPRIIVLVVDGLDAGQVTPADMPNLARAWGASTWCPNAHGRAAMPARTNTNHAALITGVTAEVHGITGNAFWDRNTATIRRLNDATDILTETVFTQAHAAARGLRTGAAVGKPKLVLLFGASAQQHAPDELWDPRTAADSAKDPSTGYAYDATTLAAAQAILEHGAVDLLVVNLADVDRTNHGAGPTAATAVETRRRTDAALGEFFDWLAKREDWAATRIIVTADHGFEAVTARLTFADSLAAAGLHDLVVVGDGGIGHVYLSRGGEATADATLAAARAVALAQPGIAEALYVRPNAADGGTRHTVAEVHRDWHLSHERSGDLLLVARHGYQFVDGSGEEATLAGNHGGPDDRDVPTVILGGLPLGASAACDDITPTDLGRTVEACLGLPPVARLDGRIVDAGDRGRVLPGLCPPSMTSRDPQATP